MEKKELIVYCRAQEVDREEMCTKLFLALPADVEIGGGQESDSGDLRSSRVRDLRLGRGLQ